jgi:hypothetical protein
VPGNPRYLTFRSVSLLEPRLRRAPEPPPPPAPEFQPPPPVPFRRPMPLPLPMMRARRAEHVPCAAQRRGMDLIMSGMTADERAELFQVSERYRKHDEWKRAQRGWIRISSSHRGWGYEEKRTLACA